MDEAVKLRNKRFALVTIGQSPRPDIAPDLIAAFDASCHFTEFGALDGLEPDEIRQLTAKEGERRLVSRLVDGTEVVCSEEAIERRLKDLFAAIPAKDFDAILLMCSGKLENIEHELPVYCPFDALTVEIQARTDRGQKIGMISPDKGQISKMQELFEGAKSASFASASPYGADEFVEAGAALQGTDFIIMNCMGYDATMAEKVEEAAGVATTTVRDIFMKHAVTGLSLQMST